MRRSPFQALLGEGLACAVLESKTGQEHPVEKTFHQSGNAAPPNRVDEGQVLSPGDVCLGLEQVGLQWLNLPVAFAQHRVEVQGTKA
ncbi:hypothetical protein D3C79_898250 [compost metagenome]